MSAFPSAITDLLQEFDERLAEHSVRIVVVVVYHDNKMALSFTPNLTPESKHNAILRVQSLLSEFISTEAL